ncbi:B12-binding domain-containing radical SAM protein [Massilibacterium senegalense]|uniref:B12-binding domain-containing radical SAM protein n=1 Tax=Massilibacterium senegalense TaxID=1632858 RepID=UPI0007863301|nr:B12-binding domain-containing radical SAM protein [Massilibacterium senegalense]
MKTVVTTLNAKYIHTCLALRYLKAYAAPEFDVEMAEYTIKDPVMNIVSDLYNKNPDVIGFSCYIWNIEQTIPIIEMLKKIKPELTIILGGPEVSYDSDDWMKRIPEVDYIVVGEGEKTFKDLLTEIQTEKNMQKVNGIYYRDGENVIMRPPQEKLDLNTIPSPFRFEEDVTAIPKRIQYIETSRGCPFSCQFCLSSIEVGVRYFDKERMKEELLFLMDHGAKTIKFVDRTFNIKRDYALEMFQFIIENHRPGVVFQFEITADIMRPEVLDYLNTHAPAGLIRFEIGVQSTNDHTNELVHRKQNFTKLARTVNMVKEGGKITQHLDLIAGLPEEDYTSFRKTFNDVFAFYPEELQLGFLKMLRGTGLRLRSKDHDYTFMNHAPYEILGNNVLSFADIIKIKQVEDVLEKYWNDHRMDETILYLTEFGFDTAFDFFQSFGAYWEKQGWAKIGHQLEDLFTRLLAFLNNESFANLDLVIGLMKYDYFIRQNYKPRKPWWTFSLTRHEQSNILRQLAEQPALLGKAFENLHLTEKELHKHTMIEVLPFDLSHYLETKEMKREQHLIVSYFSPKQNGTQVFVTNMKNLLPI